MKFFNHNNQEFLVAHLNGRNIEQYWPAIVAFQEAEISLPSDVTILTFASSSMDGSTIERTPLLVEQLRSRDIPHVNGAADVTFWQNPLKIELAVEHTARINTEYTLLTDARDVMLVGRLDDIVDRFQRYDKRVLFAATKNNYPDVMIDRVRDRDFMHPFMYLNAGCVFGRTVDIYKFYLRVGELKREIENPDFSEQFVVRHAFAEDTENVGFDWRCSIFQCFSNTFIEQQDDTVMIF